MSAMSQALVPPHNLNAEQALLGAMLLSADAIDAVADIARPEDFYRPAHGQVFQTIVRLWSANEPVDAVTVAEELARSGQLEAVGGPAALIDWQASTPAISNAAQYASIVAEHAQLRQMIRVCREMSELAYSVPTDVRGALDLFESKAFGLAHGNGQHGNGEMETVGEMMPGFIEELKERCRRAAAGEIVGGLTTGFPSLDIKLGGLEPGGLYVVGAPPGTGKSALVLDMACYNASIGNPVAGFSLEMTKKQIMARFVASQAEVISGRIRAGTLEGPDWANVEKLRRRSEQWPLSVGYQSKITPLDVRAKARRVQAANGGRLSMIFVDYLQLMHLADKAENRQNEIARISGELKGIAMEFEVPLVALAQLNRAANKAAEVRPTKHDLKDSGAIEADADGVLLIYREEVHNPATPNRGVAEIIIDKNRHGEIGKVNLIFSGKFTSFRDMSSDGSSSGADGSAEMVPTGYDGAGRHDSDGGDF